MSDGSVVITGGNRGIGLALAAILARAGQRVMIACRRPDEGERAVEALGLAASIEVTSLDLSSHASIDRFVKAAPRDLVALVNNAGAMFSERRLTDDGIEQTLAVNCVGPMRLTEALLEMSTHRPLRIVNVVTAALGRVDLDRLNEDQKHSAMGAYLNAKMAFMHVARAWAPSWKSENLAVVHSLHPGMARTGMFEAPRLEGGTFWRVMIPLLRPFTDPPERAAGTLAKLVRDPAHAEVTDSLWHADKPAKWPKRLIDPTRNQAVADAMRRLGLTKGR